MPAIRVVGYIEDNIGGRLHRLRSIVGTEIQGEKESWRYLTMMVSIGDR